MSDKKQTEKVTRVDLYENVRALKQACQQARGFRGVLVRLGGQYTCIRSFDAQRNAARGTM